MWRSLFSSAVLVGCSISAAFAQANPVPDSSFEIWINGAPSGWSANAPLILPSTNAHTGHFAAEGVVASTSDSSPYLYAMFPLSVRPSMFEGNFQLHALGGDELMVFACTFSNGAPVSQAIFEDSQTTTGYHQFNVPFLLANDDPPDSAMVLIELENSSGMLHAGSSFAIDDISFVGTAFDPFVSVKPSSSIAESFTAYPNPATQSTTLHFNTPESGYAIISIVNALGGEMARIYSGELSAGEHTFTWNADKIAAPCGMYECVVRMNATVQSVPIELEK